MEVDKRNNILAKPSGITLGQHRSDVVFEVALPTFLDMCRKDSIVLMLCLKYPIYARFL